MKLFLLVILLVFYSKHCLSALNVGSCYWCSANGKKPANYQSALSQSANVLIVEPSSPALIKKSQNGNGKTRYYNSPFSMLKMEKRGPGDCGDGSKLKEIRQIASLDADYVADEDNGGYKYVGPQPEFCSDVMVPSSVYRLAGACNEEQTIFWAASCSVFEQLNMTEITRAKQVVERKKKKKNFACYLPFLCSSSSSS